MVTNWKNEPGKVCHLDADQNLPEFSSFAGASKSVRNWWLRDWLSSRAGMPRYSATSES
jgi:hypothetical protein